MTKLLHLRKYFILFALLLALAVAFAVPASAETVSGNVPGSSLAYSYDQASGTLTISGNGEMPDFASASDTPWYQFMREIKALAVSEGVTSIGDYAFFKASSLANISLPSTLERIGKDSFYSIAVENLVLPDSLEEIGETAFRQSSLKSVKIGKSLKIIGDGAFYGCASLEGFEVDKDNAHFAAIDSILYTADRKTLVSYPAARAQNTLKMPETVENIAPYALYGAGYIGHVYIHEGVKNIGAYAFVDCSAMKNIALPASVTTIGDAAFRGCYLVKSLTLCGGLENIGSGVFSGCTKISNIYFCGSEAEYRAFADARLGDLLAALPENVAENIRNGRVPVNYNVNYEGMALDVTYVYLDGSEKTVSYTVFAGLPFRIETPAIEGTRSDMPAVEGIMGGRDLAYRVTYSPLKYYVKVLYRLDTGLLVSSIDEAHMFGDEYSYKTPAMEGYTADAEIVSGVVKGDVQIIVTYHSDSGEVNLPGGVDDVKPSGTSAAKEIKTALDGILYTVIAVLSVALCVLAVFCVVTLKRKKKE